MQQIFFWEKKSKKFVTFNIGAVVQGCPLGLVFSTTMVSVEGWGQEEVNGILIVIGIWALSILYTCYVYLNIRLSISVYNIKHYNKF